MPSPSHIADEICGDQQFVDYQCKIMMDAGLVDGKEVEGKGLPHFVYRLTWQGHEFLDAASDPTHWEKAKDVAHKSSGGFETLQSVLRSLAAEAAKSLLGF